MQFVGPQNFLELLGAALLFVGVVLSFLSLVPALRTSALRLSAISFLAALAIFSNYWVTYFAAIFIIATAVTELEFLHILAAIIRGDKNYFDFRREFLTHDEALKKSQRDAGIEGETSKIESSVKKQPAKALHISGRGRALATTAFRLEERALDWYEQKFGTPVQRYVRFIGQSRSAEVDGFVEGRPGTPDTIIEIKWFHNEHPGTGFHSRLIEQVADIYQRYELITKKKGTIGSAALSSRAETGSASYPGTVRAAANGARSQISGCSCRLQ